MKNYIFLAVTVLISCNKDNNKVNTDSKETDIQKEVIAIAEKKWIEVYGKSIEKQKPFAVKKMNDSIWIVHGTFPKPTIGGVAYAEVNIKTKKVVKYTHGE